MGPLVVLLWCETKQDYQGVYTVFYYKITCVTHGVSFLQIKIFYFLDDFLLPFVEEEFLIVVKVLLATVAADEVGTKVADGQFGDQKQHLLSLVK